MKLKSLIPGAIVAMFSAITACHSTTDNKTPQENTATETLQNDNAKAAAGDAGASSGMDLVSMFDESDPAVFNEAAEIARKTLNLSGEILESSRHLGQWYEIVISIDREGVLDGGGEKDTCFVDMAQKKAIDEGDFASVRGFYDEMLKTYEAGPEMGKDLFVQAMASITSGIAFRRGGYVLHGGGTHAPELKKNDDGTVVLEYFFNKGSTYVDHHLCRLVIAKDSISFDHRPMR